MDAVLDAKMYPKQVEMTEAVRDCPQVAVVGCNGSGKDYASGRIILQWLSSRYPAMVVAIGPTTRQVQDIVWKEARYAYNNAKVPMGGRFLPSAARWEIDDRHFAIGFSTDNEYNIQGYHSPHLLVIITEAHAVPQSHIDAVKKLTPERILMTGNAFSAGGEFFDAFHDKADAWRQIEISAFDTPNLIEDRIVIPGMVTREVVEARERDWGVESALYIASVLGQFPDNLEDGVVPRSLLLAARDRTVELGPDDTTKVILSCDVARFGDDKTVVYWRKGPIFRKIWEVQGRDTQQVAGKLLELAEDDLEVGIIVVDDVGLGGGVTDRLREELGKRRWETRGIKLVAFRGGASAQDKKHYYNAITEAWMLASQSFKDEANPLDIDNNPAVIGQLSARRYRLEGSGRRRLESKEEFKKRAKISPDDADAFVMSFAPSAVVKSGRVGGESKKSLWTD